MQPAPPITGVQVAAWITRTPSNLYAACISGIQRRKGKSPLRWWKGSKKETSRGGEWCLKSTWGHGWVGGLLLVSNKQGVGSWCQSPPILKPSSRQSSAALEGRAHWFARKALCCLPSPPTLTPGLPAPGDEQRCTGTVTQERWCFPKRSAHGC